jgi:hypothetical protein
MTPQLGTVCTEQPTCYWAWENKAPL